jgi:hypothetical protein
MSLYYVDKFMFQVTDDEHRRARFHEDPAAVLAEYQLTPEEARALANRDLPALYRLGANGYLLLRFAHEKGGDFRQVVAAMREQAPAAAHGEA